MNDERVDELYRAAVDVCKKYSVEYDEDIIQELVIHAHQKLIHYEESKSKLITFIYNCMINKLNDLYNFQFCKKRSNGLTDLPIDSPIKDRVMTYHEIIPSKTNIIDEINKGYLIDKILPLIEEPLKLYLEGYTQKEIGAILNYSQSSICRLIRKNIEIIKIYCTEKKLYN